MPTYECMILFRAMSKEKLTTAVKRNTDLIFKQGGIIRALNNLGTSSTPFKITAHSKSHFEASYFHIEFDCPTLAVKPLREAMGLDNEILRRRFYEPVKPIDYQKCKIDEETAAPPYRTEVQKMMKLAEKKKRKEDRKKTQPNTGLDFDPFPS